MHTQNYRNGEPIDNDVLQERALVYGDGVFETMRCHNQKIPLWPLHRQRLERSAARLNLRLDFSALELQLDRVLYDISQGDAVIKLIVGRSGQGRASYLPEGASTTHFFSARPLQAVSGVQKTRLRKARAPLLGCKTFSGLKLLGRLEYIVATAGMHIGPSEEALFLNEEGDVIETMHHNIFAVEGNTLITPLIEAVGVAGVMREYIFQTLASQLSLDVAHRKIEYSELTRFDGVFLSNAVNGIVTVLSVDDHPVKQSRFVDLMHQQFCELFS